MILLIILQLINDNHKIIFKDLFKNFFTIRKSVQF